jgi:hypothetical protein
MRDHHWIYNYLCNQFLSPLMLWVWIPLMTRCTCQWLVAGLVFSGYFGFLHQSRWLPQYNWNIVEVVLNTVTAHSPKYQCSELQSICLIMRSTWYNVIIIFSKICCFLLLIWWETLNTSLPYPIDVHFQVLPTLLGLYVGSIQ